MALGIQTQAGLTAYLAALVSAGLPATYLRDYPKALEKVGLAEVRAAAERFLAPSGLSTVLVGDAAAIEAPVSALGPVRVQEPLGGPTRD
jgi:predicted Zn-dependent peptidase